MIVSLLGLVIGLFAYLIAFPNPAQRRFDIYMAVFVVHLFSAIAYWLLSFEEAMDAFTYYRDPFNYIQNDPLKSGTFFIVHVVQNIRLTLGGSFLDHFIFFQCFGMIGLALLIRSFNEIADSLGMTLPWQVYLTLFLPGLHFWSAGIGKDSPMIMAICLSLWAALQIQKRLLWFAAAVIIMLLIRPHIAAIAVMAAAVALLLSKQIDTKLRVMLAPVAVIAFVFLMARVIDRFGISLDTESVSEFVETQQSNEEKYGGGANLQDLPFPLKVWSLLFRPFYIDATGPMGWAASVENTVLLGVCGYIAYHWRLLLRLSLHVYYVSYALIFSGVVVVALAMVNYNLGLGQRQKMMAVTAIILIFVTIALYKRFMRAAAAVAAQPPVTEPVEHYASAGA